LLRPAYRSQTEEGGEDEVGREEAREGRRTGKVKEKVLLSRRAKEEGRRAWEGESRREGSRTSSRMPGTSV